jgi:hypothetical protein
VLNPAGQCLQKSTNIRPMTTNNTLPTEIINFIENSQCKQDELYRAVQALLAKAPKDPEEIDTELFEEKLPIFPLSSIEAFDVFETELQSASFKKKFVSCKFASFFNLFSYY